MKVYDLDAPFIWRVRCPCSPSRRLARSQLNWALSANMYVCASDSLAAAVFAVPDVPLPASTEGMDLSQCATSSSPSPLPTDGNAPNSSSVTLHVSSTVAHDKAASETFPPALPVCPRLGRAPNGFRSSGALCCALFSLVCHPDQP